MQEIREYISVSDYAAFMNISVQSVYNMIRSNTISAVRFNRKKHSGYLVEKPIGYDEWFTTKQSDE